MREGTPAGLVLAAGAGRRFGGPKALVVLDGEPLVVRAAGVLTAGGCDPVLAVLGAAADDVRAAAPGLRSVVAPDWATGMGASLRRGLRALAGDAPAVVVGLVDTPRVTPVVVRRLVDAWRDGAVAAVAAYDGVARNPVLLDASVWGEVADAAEGDTGARGWLRAHPAQVTAVECADAGAPDDVDTPDDLAALTGRP